MIIEKVGTRVEGALGIIELNRPRAINALTHPMVVTVRETLQAWADDDRVRAVSISGAGDRGLCAGGDVRDLRSMIMDGSGAYEFWRDEYRMDATIAAHPDPVITFMDGVVMGGGVGISAHASLRLVTERSKVAMPETIIGFFPDVGALYLLARAPGELGTHLALTGATITGADAIAVGLADAQIPSTQWPMITERLVAGEVLDASVGERPASDLVASQDWIDECYAGDDPAVILQRLEEHHSPDARAAAAELTRRSPLSVAIALEAIRRAARLSSLDEVLAQDLRIGRNLITRGGDFLEGVRARLVDKDDQPAWQHRHLSQVPPGDVLAYFD